MPEARLSALDRMSRAMARISQEVSILTEEQRNNLSLYVKQKATVLTLVTVGVYQIDRLRASFCNCCQTADKPNSLAPLPLACTTLLPSWLHVELTRLGPVLSPDKAGLRSARTRTGS